MTNATAFSNRSWYIGQVVLHFTILLILLVVIEVTKIDIWLQDHFYSPVTQTWLVDSSNNILRLFFYDGIRSVYFMAAILLLITLALFRNTRPVLDYKKGLTVVFLSMLVVPLFIGWLKSITNIPCPNNLSIYGSEYPTVSLFSRYPSDFSLSRDMQCFPAGHASGGFALLSVFFVFKRKKHRVRALAGALTAGWALGLYKMLIGDHFFSHTLTSMMLAWIIVTIIAWWVFRSEIK